MPGRRQSDDDTELQPAALESGDDSELQPAAVASIELTSRIQPPQSMIELLQSAEQYVTNAKKTLQPIEALIPKAKSYDPRDLKLLGATAEYISDYLSVLANETESYRSDLDLLAHRARDYIGFESDILQGQIYLENSSNEEA